MGGSGTSCDIIQQLINNKGSIPASTLRNERMPSYINKKSLVIITSFSGNTIESISMMKNALACNAEVISVSSGGTLETESKINNCKHIKIPKISLSRSAFPYLLIPCLNIINDFLTPRRENIDTISQETKNIFDNISIDVPLDQNISKRIANFVLDGFPICYSSVDLFPAATRFKASLNENSKIHCIRESILEASHNEIVPLTYNVYQFVPKLILLRWNNDGLISNERFEKVQQFLNSIFHNVLEIKISNKSLLQSLINAIYILDMATIYAAFHRNLDPEPTPAIEILKNAQLQ
jgi:glucose/mannose-6-phosphate isomerase